MKTLWALLPWALAVALVLTLPGTPGPEAPQPPGFPMLAVGPFLGCLVALALAALAGVRLGGADLARHPLLGALEGVPELLWGVLILALWPRAWGPPAWLALGLGLLAALLPSELRWLSQALPPERPFPQAWGTAACLRARHLALRHLALPWLGARLPVWLTGALVLERVLGVAGLGQDWTTRVALRDRAGLLAWVVALAGLTLLHPRRSRA